MNIEIPTVIERAAHKYADDINTISAQLNHAIMNDTLQSNYRGHRWVTVMRSDTRYDLPDELFNFLKDTYRQAGWLLEKVWGEEGSEQEGKIIAINCFIATLE